MLRNFYISRGIYVLFWSSFRLLIMILPANNVNSERSGLKYSSLDFVGWMGMMLSGFSVDFINISWHLVHGV